MSISTSGCYIVDAAFNVVSVNDTLKSIYPGLKCGEKCYSCLMQRQSPCEVCPITNHRLGPHTYVDPIRRVAETVDAVPTPIPGHGDCYSIVISTVGENTIDSGLIPTSEEEIRVYPLIRALASDYENVFSIDLNTGDMELFRYNGQPVDMASRYHSYTSFEQAIAVYVDHHVMPEDQQMILRETSVALLKEKLKATETMMVHYRVLRDGQEHYYLCKVVRIGSADDFKQVVMGAICEDESVAQQKERLQLERNLSRVETDTVTGLLTKEAFLMRSSALLENDPAGSYDLCVMKLQHFSRLNHSYGRHIGDRVLGAIGSLLADYKEEKILIGYLGEGIFASISPSLAFPLREQTSRLFEKRAQRKSPVKDIRLRWALYTNIPHNQALAESYEKANYILSLNRGRGERFTALDQQIIARIDREEALENSFEAALKNHEFHVMFQPKYSAKDKHLVGAEALCRWKDAEDNIIMPGEFIPVLESCGYIRALDEYMFRETCRMQQYLSSIGLGQVPISVNLSQAGLLTGEVEERYSRIADSFGVDPMLVPLEITESAAMQTEMMDEFAHHMCQKGFVLHMDDFGTGYSSMASLQRIPFETIKLDKSIIDGIGTESGQSLLHHTVAFMHESGKKVVAEGVESYEQYLFLQFIGCDQVQGYYFSTPVSEEDFAKLMAVNT